MMQNDAAKRKTRILYYLIRKKKKYTLLREELTSGSRDAAFSAAGQEPACKAERKSEVTLPPDGHNQKYWSAKAAGFGQTRLFLLLVAVL